MVGRPARPATASARRQGRGSQVPINEWPGAAALLSLATISEFPALTMATYTTMSGTLWVGNAE